MNIAELRRKVEENKIKYIRYLYVDLDNVIRGRVSKAENLEVDLVGGITLAQIMQSGFSIMDLVSPETIYGPVGEVKLIPDVNTFVILPYADYTAAMLVDQYIDDKPHPVDPRLKLKDYLAKSEYKFKIGFEPEFYILKKSQSNEIVFYDYHLCFSSSGMNYVHELLKEITNALEQQGIGVEHYYPEYGSSQHELSIKPYDAIESADKLIYFRETLRGVLRKYDLYASFMPKPSHTIPGTGLHVHISVWKNGQNIFYSEKDKYNLSEEAYYFIGGILKHLKEIIGMTAASVNSYKRLRPNSWASAFACWGLENREAAIRVPKAVKGREKDTMRLELKFVDCTSNPYLAIGSIIAAGIDGIKNKIEPTEPCLDNPTKYSAEIRESKGWYRYPENLLDAIREVQRSNLLREFWGDTLISEYVKLKLFQWEQYYNYVTDWERKIFLSVY
jgi:glutamine synthetase